jgi:Ca2+-binding RTX toxin-like protein
MAVLTVDFDASLDMTQGIMPRGDFVAFGWQDLDRHSLDSIDPDGAPTTTEFFGWGFGYDRDGNLVAGRMDEVDRFVDDQPVFSLTGADVSVATVNAYVDVDDTEGEVAYIFRGNDLIQGGDHGDTLTGMGGDDDIYGGVGADDIYGDDGRDYLRGGGGDDRIWGGAGADDINGNMGQDTVSGGSGDDWVVGGQGDDDAYGDDGADIVLGNLGDDYVSGGDGADIVRGGQGDDVVVGGAGNDWLSGDRGNDTLTGGTGADIFHTFGAAGLDVVTDFIPSEGDRVLVDAADHYTVAQVGADVVITVDQAAQMILQNVQLSALPTGWIFQG